MKESHSEGVANHTDPESCGEIREELAEALTGESTGRAIEPRKYITSGRRRTEFMRKATSEVSLERDTEESREVEDPGT
jgi:hypothetical protein